MSANGSPVVTTATLVERADFGVRARDIAPVSGLAELPDNLDRDPVALLLDQAADRVPELVPIRHGRMARTPFTFYRGAALVMADDLSRTANSGLTVQLCGDAHLSNFGFFATPERRLAFDVNDFDETYPGPFEWDVKRLAASLVVAAIDNGLTAKEAKKIARAAAAEYRATMHTQAGRGTLDIWYSHTEPTRSLSDVRKMVDVKTVKSIRKQIDKAWGRNSLQALTKLTVADDDGLHFISDPPLIVPVEELFADRAVDDIYSTMPERLREYRDTVSAHHRVLLDKFEFTRMARKVVGVGSVGTQAWVLLYRGRDEGDPLLLQAKQAQQSVLARYLDGPTYENEGERVVYGQRLTQAVSDVFLGWYSGPGFDNVPRDFYVRQLRDAKGSVVIETLDGTALSVYGQTCARVLAFGHARSGDPVAIDAYLGDTDQFDRAIGKFAARYAALNARDHANLVGAIDRGLVPAVHDV